MATLMSPEVMAIISSVIATASGGSSVWFWHDKKRNEKLLDEIVKQIQQISKQQVEHDGKFITEAETRRILQEHIEEIRKSWAETNSDVKEIRSVVSELVTELKIINAVKEAEKNRNN